MGFWDKTVKFVESELDRRIESSSGDAISAFEPLEKALKEDGYGRKGLIFDPFQDMGYSGGLFRPKGAGSGFLSNFILKIVSRRDPIVSTILHIRSNQASTFCRLQSNRFDTGFKIECKDIKSEPNEKEIKEIEDFLLNCGETENRSSEDKLTLNQFGYMITHDMLTYGHCAIELIRARNGTLHSFLPIPAETIYYANKALINKEQVGTMIDIYRDAYQNLHGMKERFDEDKFLNEDYEFLQVINGKVVEGFNADEMILARVYDLSEIDLNGYALGPLERSISMITAHLQIENHQKMFFTHGFASKGLLVIKGDVTPNQLRTLQAQWTNQISGSQSAWRTPILAGIEGVQWENLSPGSRDMEYAAYQDHVIRTIHASFAIDPEETGFGYLSKGVQQKSLSESNNEWKVTASRDRGLRPLLARIESIINEDIIAQWNKEYYEKYQFCFVGLDAENRKEEIERLQSEVQLHTTLDEVREQADLDPIEIGGGIILNQVLLQVLQSNIYKGVFMEKFLGINGAADRPDLQYIPDPMWFQWQETQMQMMQQQAMSEAGLSPEGEVNGDTGTKSNDRQKNGNNNNSGSNSSKSGNNNNEAQQQKQEEMMAQQQAMAQAQMSAVDKYISANPDLFKSMNENLKKSKYNDSYVEKMRVDLTKDFEKASENLMKEIFQAVKEDIDERKEADESVVKSDLVSEDSVGDFLIDEKDKELSEEDKDKKKKKKKKKKDRDWPGSKPPG